MKPKPWETLVKAVRLRQAQEVAAGGAEPPEEPATGEVGRQTKGAEANKGLSE